MNDQHRSRFSIATMLLVSALIACSISHFVVSWELATTKKALTALRNDALVLDADDDKLLHVIALPTYGELQWRWRLQLPSEGTYRLRYAIDEIPCYSLPENSQPVNRVFVRSDGSNLSGVSFVLEIGIFKDGDGVWQFSATNGDSGRIAPIKSPPKWLDSKTATGWGSFVTGTGRTKSSSSTDALTLLSLRRSKKIGNASTVDESPADGLVVWVERVD